MGTSVKKERPRRKGLRYGSFDYSSPGAYFVTICTHEKSCIFGRIVGGEMFLNDLGRVAEEAWRQVPVHFPEMRSDAWVVMPNHVHGIVFIAGRNTQEIESGSRQIQVPRALGAIVGGYKSSVTRRIRRMRPGFGTPVWQRGYYDRIVRDEDELNAIREYIADNPRLWGEDPNNPDTWR